MHQGDGFLSKNSWKNSICKLTGNGPAGQFGQVESSLSCEQGYKNEKLGILRKGVFERRKSNGSEILFILKHLDATKFVLLSVFTIIEAICLRSWAKPPSKNEKRLLPVDVFRSKTSLLKLSNILVRLGP